MERTLIGLVIAIASFFAALTLIIIALMFGGGGTIGGMGGHMMGSYSLSDGQIIMIIIASGIFIAAITFLIYAISTGKEQKPSYPSTTNLSPNQPVSFQMPEQIASTDEHQISRLLNGDERNLYQLLASSGGEMLQKDIVAKNVFSKAKVTRLLDKLEEKGIILRERHGMTNRIKLVK